jgi:hypothetical protein
MARLIHVDQGSMLISGARQVIAAMERNPLSVGSC